MKKFLVRTGIGFLVLAVGATIGPVAIAAVSALASSYRQPDPYGVYDAQPDFYHSSEAAKLVQAYREHLPTGVLFSATVYSPKDGTLCGYKPEEIFPDSMESVKKTARSRVFTDYAGYSVLDGWRNETQDKEWISAITASVDDQMSKFEIGFLRRCIEATLFAPLCMRRVAELGFFFNPFAYFVYFRNFGAAGYYFLPFAQQV